MDLKQKQKIVEVSNEIETIKIKLESLKASLDRIIDTQDTYEISVYDVRRAAILEEVYRENSIVSSDELSEIARKWGRNPQGTAGYFSGTNPSLRAIAGGKRALTERGLEIVMENRNAYGQEWLDRVDKEFVGNPNTPHDVYTQI